MMINEVMRRNRDAGRHFFDPDTMKGFGSRVEAETADLGDGYVLFLTSERDREVPAVWDGRRRWTIRIIGPDGEIDTVDTHWTGTPADAFDGFGAFRSKRTALRHAALFVEHLRWVACPQCHKRVPVYRDRVWCVSCDRYIGPASDL